eukprot:1409669-Pleurochrysis_carterae.AAC.4
MDNCQHTQTTARSEILCVCVWSAVRSSLPSQIGLHLLEFATHDHIARKDKASAAGCRPQIRSL